jgi:hypothetical protein
MTTDQKKKLLKAKIAVALRDELGRVTEEIRATGNLLVRFPPLHVSKLVFFHEF